MGLATIDPHSHKVQTKLDKIRKFGVNIPNSKKDSAIWKRQNLQRNVWSSGRCVGKRPNGHTFLNKSKWKADRTAKVNFKFYLFDQPFI